MSNYIDYGKWNNWVTLRSTILVEESIPATTTTTTTYDDRDTDRMWSWQQTTTTPVSTTTTTTTTTIGNLRPLEVPDNPFPRIYTPAQSYWLRALMRNCSIPWRHPGDILTTFFAAGGSQGTLVGTLSGLVAVDMALNDFTNSKIFGFGYSYPFPQIGYCIGDVIKQQVYVKFDVTNAGSGIKVLSRQIPTIELLQNSRFKRIYVNHGKVVRYEKDINGRPTLILDIADGTPTPLSTMGNFETLTITQKSGNKFGVQVLEILDNWEIKISDPGNNVIQTGDFYQLNTTWCIEDPFLLSGIWYGNESDQRAIDVGKPNSGLNLYWTSQQSPYEEGEILGAYAWANIETGAMGQAPVGINMRDFGGFEWRWKALVPDEKRYKEILKTENEQDTAEVTTTTTSTRAGAATISQFGAFFGEVEKYTERTPTDNLGINENTKYVRIDISTGGHTFRHNWYAPCLKGSYIKSDNNLYEIINHIEAGIIDVDINSIDGLSKFNPEKNRDYSIINQKGWLITEHYNERLGGTQNQGIFKGIILKANFDDKNNSTVITLKTNGDSFPTWTNFDNVFDPPDIPQNNFANRYKKTHYHESDEPVKKYTKYQNWKLVVNNVEATINGKVKKINREYSIDPLLVRFPGYPTITDPSPPDAEYIIELTVEGNILFLLNKPAYISFDNTFETLEAKPKETGSDFSLEIDGSATSPIAFLSEFSSLCLEGEYRSNPYKVNIPNDARVGFCEGTYFGLSTTGDNFFSNVFFLITTEREPVGIASLFHALRQEDWVVYQDVLTKKLVARRGSLDYREYPMKSEIVTGKPDKAESIADTNVIALNRGKQRLRRLQFIVPEGDDADPAIMFGIGEPDNIYGFIVTGEGLVDLQMLRRKGIGRGQQSPNFYQFDQYNVSPVYVYKKSYFQKLDEKSVDIGIATNEGPVYIKDGNVTEIKVQYTDENRTLGRVGFFDIIRMADGENLLIYGQEMEEFWLRARLNNSSSFGNEWQNKNAVMAIGTFNDSFVWGTPLAKVWGENDQYQHPLMILNGVQYLASIYNPSNESLSIFVKCFNVDGESYVGCLRIAILSFLHKTESAQHVDSSNTELPLNFLWRPPLLDNKIVTDPTRSWVEPSDVIVDGYVFDANTTKVKDEFSRILGPATTQSQVEYNNETNIATAHILPDGTYIFFYDSPDGTRAIYSNNGGMEWITCDLIYAKNASSAIMVDKYMFYITPAGIEFKDFNITDYYAGRNIALKKVAGEDVKTLEISTQITFDSTRHSLIKSGSIPIQRLSGYVTSYGIIKMFYYDLNGLLICLESSDSFNWNVADNY